MRDVTKEIPGNTRDEREKERERERRKNREWWTSSEKKKAAAERQAERDKRASCVKGDKRNKEQEDK